MSSRLMRRVAGLLALLLLLGVLALGVAQVPGVVGDKVSQALSSLNPFDEDPVDRTGPAVLQSLTALSEFKAARGYYEVVVDFEPPNGNLPDFINGNRVIYVGKGEVEAVVDFSELDERRITRSADGTSVTVTLPAPRVGEPKLDLETSYVALRDEGFVTRFKGSDIEREAQLLAIQKLAAAAKGEGRLIELAEQSTEAMLRGVFGSLGYTSIEITFDPSPAGSQ
jgi:hypothetical protein